MNLAVEDEAWIRAELARARVPGAALAWVDRGGAVGHLEHGFADLFANKSVDATTRFHLFSGTKLYTASAVMLLAERGVLALDAPVKTYLPELSVRDDLVVAHLLSHASGLPDSLAAFLSIHLAGDPIPTTREALSRYRLGRGRTPGGGAAYRNVNYALLGELVSRMSGQPFETFVTHALLEPLGANLSFEDDGDG